MISSSDIQQQIARLEEKALQLKEQVFYCSLNLNNRKNTWKH